MFNDQGQFIPTDKPKNVKQKDVITPADVVAQPPTNKGKEVKNAEGRDKAPSGIKTQA